MDKEIFAKGMTRLGIAFPILGFDEIKIEMFWGTLLNLDNEDFEGVISDIVTNVERIDGVNLIAMIQQGANRKKKARLDNVLKLREPMNPVSKERLKELMKPILGRKHDYKS